MTDDEIGRGLAERVAAARDHAQLTQRELAEAAGMSIPQLSRIERGLGAATSLRLLIAIAGACRVDASWMIGGATCCAPEFIQSRLRRERQRAAAARRGKDED